MSPTERRAQMPGPRAHRQALLALSGLHGWGGHWVGLSLAALPAPDLLTGPGLTLDLTCCPAFAQGLLDY